MLEIIICAALIALDQITKWLSAEQLTKLANNTLPLIDGVFELTYVENRGAAFGMMQNGRWIFLVLTVAVAVAIVVFIVKERNKISTLMRVSVALMLAGALGNFIDRLILGYVRDMFSFVLINFAVFNVADSAICVGAALLFIAVLFTKKGKEFMKRFDEKKPKKGADEAAAEDGSGAKSDAKDAD